MKPLELSRRAAWLAVSAMALGAVPAAGKDDMQLTSPVFAEGKSIPREYTCDGSNISPALQWSGAPATARSFALICDDPDAPVGTWVHWVLYDLPPATHELARALPGTETLPDGSRQGRNDFGRSGYDGPCPPPGKPHRYFFKLYALDTAPALKPGATKAELLQAIEGHVLAEAHLMGTYQRNR